MIEIVNQEYFDRVKAFAERTGQLKKLIDRIEWLDNYAGGECKCVLHKDFAPASFEFLMMRKDGSGEWVRWFNGGLIYHGNQAGWDDSGKHVDPLSVTLGAHDGWSIHT